jgi:hypothetical protein
MSPVPLPDPKILTVQGVFELGEFGRDQARDDTFVAAVKGEFPHVQNRQFLGPDVPPQVPHLMLASQSAQLSLSAVVAEAVVQFYGEYLANVDKALAYAERKIRAVHEALEGVGAPTSTLGIVARMHFPYPSGATAPSAAKSILDTLTAVDVAEDDLEDAQLKVALKVAGTYFVHLAVENYEVRSIEQPLQVGMVQPVQPWRGKTEETGIEVAVDVNNKWERRRKQEQTQVSPQGLGDMLTFFRHVVTDAGPRFAETGTLSVADLAAVSEVKAADA